MVHWERPHSMTISAPLKFYLQCCKIQVSKVPQCGFCYVAKVVYLALGVRGRDARASPAWGRPVCTTTGAGQWEDTYPSGLFPGVRVYMRSAHTSKLSVLPYTSFLPSKRAFSLRLSPGLRRDIFQCCCSIIEDCYCRTSSQENAPSRVGGNPISGTTMQIQNKCDDTDSQVDATGMLVWNPNSEAAPHRQK